MPKGATPEEDDLDRTEEFSTAELFELLGPEATSEDADPADESEPLDPAIAENQARISALESELDARLVQLSEVNSEIHEATTTIARLESECRTASGRESVLELEVEARDRRIEDLEQRLTELNDALAESSEEKSALVEEHLHLADLVSEQQKRVETLQTEIGQQNRVQDLYLEQLHSTEARFHFRDARIAELNAQLGRWESDNAKRDATSAAELEMLRTRVAEGDGELEDLRRELHEAQGKLEAAEESSATHQEQLEQSKQGIDKQRAELAEQSETIAALEGKLSARAERIDSLKEELADQAQIITARERELDVRDNELNKIRGELGERRSQLESAQRELADARKSAEGLERLAKAAEESATNHRDEAEKLRNRLAETQGVLSERDTELGELKHEVENESHAINTFRSDLETKIRQIEELEEELQSATEMVSAQQRQLSKWNDQAEANERTVEQQAAEIGRLEMELARVAEVDVSDEASDELEQQYEATITALQDELVVKAEQNNSLRQELDDWRRQSHVWKHKLEEREARIAQLSSDLRMRHLEATSSRKADHNAGTQEWSEPVARPRDSTVRLLVAIEGKTEIKHPLFKTCMTIGRTPDNDIQISARYVSRYHARVVNGTGATIIEDLHSKNGVYVNGQRVERHVLKNGDEIAIGHCHFRFVDKPRSS